MEVHAMADPKSSKAPLLPDNARTIEHPTESPANSLVLNIAGPKSMPTSIRSILDDQPLEFQLRAMNGRLTVTDLRKLPPHTPPLPYPTPKSLNETVDI